MSSSWRIGVLCILSSGLSGACLTSAPVCGSGDLDCLLSGMIFREGQVQVDTVEVSTQAIPTASKGSAGGAADPRAPSITNQPADLSFSEGSDEAEALQLDWSDPNHCQPTFCLSLCSQGVGSTRLCAARSRCTHTLRDGRSVGSWRPTLSYSAQPADEITVSLEVTPAVIPDCSDAAEALRNGPADGVTIVTGIGMSVGQRIVPPLPTPPKQTGTCSGYQSCGGTCSFRACAGSSADVWYESSTHQIFPCAAASNCTAAAKAVVTLCCPNP